MGKLSGWLLADQGGTTTRLSPLSLERFPTPRLKLVGAAEGAGINLTSKVASFRHKFWIESTNRGPVKSLQVLVAPLTGPDSAQVETTWTLGGQPASPSSVPLAGLGSLDLEVTGELTVAGTYAGSVTLIYADRRETTLLSITRIRPQPAVEILGVDTVAATTFFSWNSPVVRLTLHETAGEPLSLNPPALLSLSRKGRNQEKLQARYSASSLVDSEGDGKNKPLPLPAGGTASLKLELSSLDGAGEYTGTVRVSGGDTLPLDQPFTILLKEWWPTPFLIISLGVGVSFLLRLWMTRIQPQLDREIRLQNLDEQLERRVHAPRGLETDELAVVSGLRGQLDSLYQQLAAGDDHGTDDTLKDIAQKVGIFPLWVNVRRRVAAISATEVRLDLKHKLDGYTAYLRDPGHDDAAYKNLSDFLATITSRIDAALKADLLASIGELAADIDHERPGLQAANQLRLDDEILPLVIRARDQANAEHLAAARLVFDQRRGAMPACSPTTCLPGSTAPIRRWASHRTIGRASMTRSNCASSGCTTRSLTTPTVRSPPTTRPIHCC